MYIPIFPFSQVGIYNNNNKTGTSSMRNKPPVAHSSSPWRAKQSYNNNNNSNNDIDDNDDDIKMMDIPDNVTIIKFWKSVRMGHFSQRLTGGVWAQILTGARAFY